MNTMQQDDWAALTVRKNSPSRVVIPRPRREERVEKKTNVAVVKSKGAKPAEKKANEKTGKEQLAESIKPRSNIAKPRKWIPVIEIKPRQKRKRGVTLVELLVGLGIITIISTIAVPFFQSYAINANLKSAAREIESDFFDLSQRALTENATYAIVFAPDQNNYTIQQGGSSIQVKTPTTFGEDIRILSAPFGGGTTIAFQTRGTATAGSVNLANSRGSTAIITVNIAGRTNVQFNML
jgi:type IV fimbrial biogenesis protein FimT